MFRCSLVINTAISKSSIAGLRLKQIGIDVYVTLGNSK